MDVELHAGMLGPSASTATTAPGAVTFGTGTKLSRSKTTGAVGYGSPGGGEEDGAGGEGVGVGRGKHHSGVLSESDESRSKPRAGKVSESVGESLCGNGVAGITETHGDPRKRNLSFPMNAQKLQVSLIGVGVRGQRVT